MSNIYRPANGIEYDGFTEVYCRRCELNRPFREGTSRSCDILHAAWHCNMPDVGYWIYGAHNRPMCTAFEPEQPVSVAP